MGPDFDQRRAAGAFLRSTGTGIVPAEGCPIEAHHVEAAIKVVAYAVVTHGDVYAPILDRLEVELAELRRRKRPADRARAILEAYTLDGDLKAIR